MACLVLVREVLSSEQTFNIAVGNLCASELMAPVYLTICGTQPGEGLVLSRDREGKNTAECVCERLDEKCDSVVQTNMDIYKCDRNDVKDDWQDICDSRYRRSYAKAALASVESLSMNDLWLLFSCYPCLACDTVYTTSMVPKTGELITRVEVTRNQKMTGKDKYSNIDVSNLNVNDRSFYRVEDWQEAALDKTV